MANPEARPGRENLPYVYHEQIPELITLVDRARERWGSASMWAVGVHSAVVIAALGVEALTVGCIVAPEVVLPVVLGAMNHLFSPDNIGGTVTVAVVIGISAATIGLAAESSEGLNC